VVSAAVGEGKLLIRPRNEKEMTAEANSSLSVIAETVSVHVTTMAAFRQHSGLRWVYAKREYPDMLLDIGRERVPMLDDD
jgi:hypothetical protein